MSGRTSWRLWGDKGLESRDKGSAKEGSTVILVHSVYFWLKPELTPEQLADFAAGLRSLAAIEAVKTIYVGKPVPSDRPVVESSYTYGLVIGFDDQQGLDAYQVHQVHVAFVKRFKPYWNQIKVYDLE